MTSSALFGFVMARHADRLKERMTMATLNQIQSRIAKLQRQAEELHRKETSAVIADIQKLMVEHGLTTADLDAHTGTARNGAKRGPKPGSKHAGKVVGGAAATKTSTGAKSKLPPKYRNSKTGETWSGHARPPQWIANVRDRTKFLIDGASATGDAGVASKAKTAVKKASAVTGAVAHNGQRKGPQPAKYRDPKSGATWSGRGPAPAWLAGSKDRTRFLIAGAGTAADAGAATGPKAAAKKATPAKEAATKKAVVAKKVPVKTGVATAPEAAAVQAAA
jgi:DNA-binding protein H-NS